MRPYIVQGEMEITSVGPGHLHIERAVQPPAGRPLLFCSARRLAIVFCLGTAQPALNGNPMDLKGGEL